MGPGPGRLGSEGLGVRIGGGWGRGIRVWGVGLGDSGLGGWVGGFGSEDGVRVWVRVAI